MGRIKLQLDNLPELLRATRHSKGVSRTELALMLKVSHNSVRDYEQGRRRPTPQNLMKILDFCEVEYDQNSPLFTGREG